LGKRGVSVAQCYAVAECGVIADESEAREGLVVRVWLIVEFVRPGTGDLSAFMPGASPCGRTGKRIKGWMGRADQTAKVKGMFVHPAQVAEVSRRHPELGRLRLVVGRAGEQDTMVLMAECEKADRALEAAVAATLQNVTKLKGTVKLAAPGSLPNDGKVIADERPVG
jgi:phenylacetate-CoA ligase